VEESATSPNLVPKIDHDDSLVFNQQRAQELLARFDQEREEAKRERQAGRPQGKLTAHFIGKLWNCNVLQLKRVKQICDRFIKDHRRPPADSECGKRYTLQVLESVTVNHERFRLEFQRSSKRAKQIYVNGPYVLRYWQDGSIIRTKYIKKDKELRRNLPKKVWLAVRGHLVDPDTEITPPEAD
jgi:hypothetical protein